MGKELFEVVGEVLEMIYILVEKVSERCCSCAEKNAKPMSRSPTAKLMPGWHNVQPTSS